MDRMASLEPFWWNWAFHQLIIGEFENCKPTCSAWFHIFPPSHSLPYFHVLHILLSLAPSSSGSDRSSFSHIALLLTSLFSPLSPSSSSSCVVVLGLDFSSSSHLVITVIIFCLLVFFRFPSSFHSSPLVPSSLHSGFSDLPSPRPHPPLLRYPLPPLPSSFSNSSSIFYFTLLFVLSTVQNMTTAVVTSSNT